MPLVAAWALDGHPVETSKAQNTDDKHQAALFMIDFSLLL